MLTSGPCKVLPTASIYFVFTFVTRICLLLVLTNYCPWQSFASCLPLFLEHACLWSLQSVVHGKHLRRVYLCSTGVIYFVFVFVPRTCSPLVLVAHKSDHSLLPSQFGNGHTRMPKTTTTNNNPPPPTTTTTTTSNASNTEDVVTCENYRRLSGERPLETADLHQFPICGFDAAVNQKETEAVRRLSTR